MENPAILQQPRLALAVVAFALVFGIFTEAYSCPATFINMEFPVPLTGSRNQVRLFTKKKSSQNWDSIPLQIDPLTTDGRFQFFTDESWRQAKLEAMDRFIFDSPLGDSSVASINELPCHAKKAYRLKAAASEAYLTLCEGFYPPVPTPSLPPARHADNSIETTQYHYEFSPSNQMLFRHIVLGSEPSNRKIIAEDSDLLIRSDVKNFFELHFNSQNFESHLERSRPGPVGTLAELSFYLKILFFRLKMSLITDVTFARDSGHIPMVVQLPVDAFRHLHPKSGILYSWHLANGALIEPAGVQMPILKAEEVSQGYDFIAKKGLQYCAGNLCRFSVRAESGESTLVMQFGIARNLVQRGFFPFFVASVDAHNEDMGWNLQPKQLNAGRIGLYFEVSGLPAGGHPWDFWLRLGDQKSAEESCPKPMVVSLLKK